MYRFQAAYREQSGGLRGYIGYGWSPSTAEADAKNQISADCQARKEPADFSAAGKRYFRTKHKLTKPEIQSLIRQWEQIKKARRDAGASIV